MFNEGYDAHQGEELIRQDLCFEALRLARLVAESSVSAPRVHALVALIALQTARLPARTDGVGDLVLLDQQDRSRWDERLIAIGFHHFDRSIVRQTRFRPSTSKPPLLPRTPAPRRPKRLTGSWCSRSTTSSCSSSPARWSRSTAASRSRAFTVPQAALVELDRLDHESALRNYYLLPAVRGQLLAELDRREAAIAAYREALALSCNAPERRFLQQKIDQLEQPAPEPNWLTADS